MVLPTLIQKNKKKLVNHFCLRLYTFSILFFMLEKLLVIPALKVLHFQKVSTAEAFVWQLVRCKKCKTAGIYKKKV